MWNLDTAVDPVADGAIAAASKASELALVDAKPLQGIAMSVNLAYPETIS
jgi:hypothetical protein